VPTRSQSEVLFYELEKELAIALAEELNLTISKDIVYGRYNYQSPLATILVRCSTGRRGPLSQPQVWIRVRARNMEEAKPMIAKISEFLDHKSPTLATINAYFVKIVSDEQVRNEVNRASIPLGFQSYCTPKAGVTPTV